MPLLQELDGARDSGKAAGPCGSGVAAARCRGGPRGCRALR